MGVGLADGARTGTTEGGPDTPAHGPNVLIAIDGGNSKTDVAIATMEGELLARRRGPGYSPHVSGVQDAVTGLEGLVRDALSDAGVPFGSMRILHTAAYLAGVDLAREQREMHSAILARGWSPSATVDNDTFALLRLGTTEGLGVAVVCGAGINCVGANDRELVRFPSLGPISGDWGGGLQLGVEAMSAAAREADGRGEATALTGVVLDHFGAARVIDVVERLHFGELATTRLGELSPAVFTAAEHGDAVANRLVERLADEVADYAIAAAVRLGVADGSGDGGTAGSVPDTVPVVLGGGVLAARRPLFTSLVESRIRSRVPHVEFRYVTDAPILGAVLLGLDHLGRTVERGALLTPGGR
ncbi:N-acetylglucosamine kinase [Plantibacter sp. YIM 135249]|uniref:N-acetylglucosamine kinase n=1 Tax=Plantibacter sp. YIM 135249 TaxID=3423918 RepID=UPI003D338821